MNPPGTVSLLLRPAAARSRHPHLVHPGLGRRLGVAGQPRLLLPQVRSGTQERAGGQDEGLSDAGDVCGSRKKGCGLAQQQQRKQQC